MTGLADILRRRIGEAGPLGVDRYMEMALGHPEYGYYRGADRLGLEGDFTTAPEISQMFGELIGLWSAVLWRQMGRPDPLLLVELGPGRGTLMADFLRAARGIDGLPGALRVHLVEASPGFRTAQEKTLANATAFPIQWHDEFASVPHGPMILIANEFFDALPIRQFERTAAGWRERLVGLAADGDGFRFVLSEAAPEVDLPAAAAEGAVAEICPLGREIAGRIGWRLMDHGGAALLIDYGYADAGPSGIGHGDSLQAVRGHAFHDVLVDPGTADLTAHVDFAALGRAALAEGVAVHGPVGQGAFLQGLGIDARLAALTAKATPAQAVGLRSGHRRLTDPAGMGTLFKAMAIAHPALKPLAGFAGKEE